MKTSIQKKMGPVWPFLLSYFIGLGILGSFRLLFIIWQWDRVTLVDGFWTVLATGVRIDTILLCELLALPVCVYFFLPNHGGLGHFRFYFSRIWLLAGTLTVVFMELATPSYIIEYDTRPSQIFVEYLIYPKEVFGTLWVGYKPQLFVTALVLYFLCRIGHRFFRKQFTEVPIWSWKKQVAVFPILFCLLFLGTRSSLGHRPANPSIASFSNDHLVNDLTLNSTYSVLFAIYNLKHEANPFSMYGEMEEQRVFQEVRNAMIPKMGPMDEISEEIPTLHLQIAGQKRDQKPNLVIILEESMGAQFNASLGGKNLTPELTKWSQKGWWFSSMYATGTRSVRGIEAIISGFPPSPSRSVVKLSKSQTGFYTIARTLKDIGYQTEFIYGGESHFDNMRQFFLGNGFDRIIDQDDYPNPSFVATWGVSDEDLFKKAHDRFLDHGNNPFFALVFTSSFHSPFEYPSGRIDPGEGDPFTRENAVKYADYALGEFLTRAEQSDYWKNTIFLVVADHDSRVHGASLVPVNHFHIPALILGLGGEIKANVFSKMASQLDLPPTLFSLMGITSKHPMIGRDLSQLPENIPGRAIFQYEKYFAYVEEDQAIVFSPKIPPQSFVNQNEVLIPASKKHPEDFVKKALAHVLLPNILYRDQRYRDTP